MKKAFKIIGLLLFLFILAFVARVLITTGFFRKIQPQFDGKILASIPLKGAEDMMVSYQDSFLLVSSTDRSNFDGTHKEEGDLFFIDLKTNDYKPVNLTESFTSHFSPHGISMIKKDSAYLVMAINHTPDSHFIEVFELRDEKMKHLRTLSDPTMISPNDLVIVSENQVYFTNDHKYAKGFKKSVEEYSGLSIANAILFDGENYREVADGIAYANGINIDMHRSLLYVASPRNFHVKVYSMNTEGDLAFIENIPCKTGVDNIEMDEQGRLWIGAHPNLLRFGSYATSKKETAPSEIIRIEYREKGNYKVDKIYVEKGDTMSGSSVAVPFGNRIFTGNVMDDAFLVLERNTKE